MKKTIAVLTLLSASLIPAARAQSPYDPGECIESTSFEASFEYDYLYSWWESWAIFATDYFIEVGCWPDWLF
jgi:hypothetical protein